MLYLKRFLPGASRARFTAGGTVNLDLDGVPQRPRCASSPSWPTTRGPPAATPSGQATTRTCPPPGCLREAAERGHDASHQRVTRLLAGHGIDGGRAGPLLDAAYRGRSLGQLRQRHRDPVGYDRAHSEFTVSIPRQERVSSPPAPRQGKNGQPHPGSQSGPSAPPRCLDRPAGGVPLPARHRRPRDRRHQNPGRRQPVPRAADSATPPREAPMTPLRPADHEPREIPATGQAIRLAAGPGQSRGVSR